MRLVLLFLPALLLAQKFEVASVKPHKGNFIRSGPLVVTGPLIRLEGYTIFGLIIDAYHLRDYQLQAGFKGLKPEDIADDMYDISARAPGAGKPKIEDVRLMLQALLADRFGLVTHREQKERQVYALTAAKGGPHFKPASGDAPCQVKSSNAPDGRNVEEVFTNCTVERLADRLTNIMSEGRPVIDETALTGVYDFRLVMTPGYRQRGGASEPTDISATAALGSLGLRLTGKKAPVEVLVIDKLSKPTPE
jgi:uncharacterized protein (TIGR03435 family)